MDSETVEPKTLLQELELDAPAKAPKSRRRRKAAIAAAVVVAGGLAFVGLNGLPFSSGVTSNDEVVAKVRALVPDLPADETPIVATLEDVDALVLQDGFYFGAENGDRVVVFPINGQALIYRADSDSIVKQGTTSVNPDE